MASKQEPKATKKKPASKKPVSKKASAKKPAAGKKPVSKRTGGGSGGTQKSRSPKTGKKVSTGPGKAGSRAVKRKTSGKSRSKGKGTSGPRWFGGILLLVLGAAALGMAAYLWLQVPVPVAPDPQAPSASPPQAETPSKTRQFEKSGKSAIPPTQATEPLPAALPPTEPQAPIAPALPDTRPRVAIIIDDIGESMEMAEKFFNLDAELTFAILPHARNTREIAETAVSRGYQVMLHLPMEPNEYPRIDSGPGSLLTGMTPDERIRQLKINLDAVPHAQGVNNHMGSKMTAMFDQMNQIFSVLKKRGLFFVDSRTTAASQCRSSARLFHIAFAERDVFLDHVPQREAIFKQIEELMAVAEINGSAVAIGHPHPLTYQVLKAALPEVKRRVRLVPASALVKTF